MVFRQSCWPKSFNLIPWRSSQPITPDPSILATLQTNVNLNSVADKVNVLGLDWKEPPEWLSTAQGTFDLVVAADTLWNSDTHSALLNIMELSLRRGGSAILVAGLHTGRWAIQRFVELVEKRSDLRLDLVEEHKFRAENGEGWRREFDPSMDESEDEVERRKWVVAMSLTKMSCFY